MKSYSPYDNVPDLRFKNKDKKFPNVFVTAEANASLWVAYGSGGRAHVAGPLATERASWYQNRENHQERYFLAGFLHPE